MNANHQPIIDIIRFLSTIPNKGISCLRYRLGVGNRPCTTYPSQLFRPWFYSILLSWLPICLDILPLSI